MKTVETTRTDSRDHIDRYGEIVDTSRLKLASTYTGRDSRGYQETVYVWTQPDGEERDR